MASNFDANWVKEMFKDFRIEDNLLRNVLNFAGTNTGRLSGNKTFEWIKSERRDMPENQNFSKLIKLLGMTTASNDNEALAAMRMANKQMELLGWTWEKLLTTRVMIVEDPFNDAPVLQPKRKNEIRCDSCGADCTDNSVPDRGDILCPRCWSQREDGRRRAEELRRRPQPTSPVQGPRRRPTAPRARNYSADGVSLKDLGL